MSPQITLPCKRYSTRQSNVCQSNVVHAALPLARSGLLLNRVKVIVASQTPYLQGLNCSKHWETRPLGRPRAASPFVDRRPVVVLVLVWCVPVRHAFHLSAFMLTFSSLFRNGTEFGHERTKIRSFPKMPFLVCRRPRILIPHRSRHQFFHRRNSTPVGATPDGLKV